MPLYDECSIYDDKCRNKTCSHVTNKSRPAVPMDEFITIRTERGIRFKVVYGRRQYRNGFSFGPVVAFYDTRFEGDTPHGQFVSDYDRETLLKRQQGYALNLYGGDPDWTIDAAAMYVVMTWLNHMAWQEEN